MIQEPDQTVTLPTYTCQKCGHTWVPRQVILARCCPKCNSPYWATPRSKKAPDGPHNAPESALEQGPQ